MAKQLKSERSSMNRTQEYILRLICRHVALLQIQGKEFQLTPLPLRTVRPFIIEDIVLSEIAEEVGLDLNDQMAINKFLKGKVSLFSCLNIRSVG